MGMTFIKTTCQDCGECILMDERNGIGYCMYCGAEVDASDSKKLPLGLRKILEDALEDESVTNGKVWHKKYQQIVGTLDADGPGAAAPLFSEILGTGLGSDELDELRMHLRDATMGWFMTQIDSMESGGYAGGCKTLIDLVDEGSGESTFGTFYQIGVMQMAPLIEICETEDEARCYLRTLFNLTREFMSSETDPIAVLESIANVFDIVGRLNDVLGIRANDNGADPDDPYRVDRFMSMLMANTAVLIIRKIDDAGGRKALVKIGRNRAGVDLAAAHTSIDMAFDAALACDPDAMMGHVADYADIMFSQGEVKKPRKASKKARRRL